MLDINQSRKCLYSLARCRVRARLVRAPVELVLRQLYPPSTPAGAWPSGEEGEMSRDPLGKGRMVWLSERTTPSRSQVTLRGAHWPPGGIPAAEGDQAPEPHGQDQHHSSAPQIQASLSSAWEGERKKERADVTTSDEQKKAWKKETQKTMISKKGS